jgi:hypothetical protein
MHKDTAKFTVRSTAANTFAQAVATAKQKIPFKGNKITVHGKQSEKKSSSSSINTHRSLDCCNEFL